MRHVSNRIKKLRKEYAILLVLLLIVVIGILYTQNEKISTPEGFEVSSGWTVTSYCLVNEALYNGDKVEVFDSHGNSLGFYKSDFLKQIRIDGAGKGDGVQNPGKILQYNYRVNDGKTCYLTDKPIGAHGIELIPWTGDEPSVAVNPPVPYGTMIRFKDLGTDGEKYPDWVIELLKNKTFFADDTFFLGDWQKHEKRIDVYLGLQTNRYGSTESLLMHDVTIYIKYPE